MLIFVLKGGDGVEGGVGEDGDHLKHNVTQINNCIKKNMYIINSDTIEECNLWTHSSQFESYYFLIEHGQIGMKGGDAGKGGSGGKNGLPGESIAIEYFDKNAETKVKRKSFLYCNECRGENGFSGKPGIGGLNGKNALMNIAVTVDIPGWRFVEGNKWLEFNGRYLVGSVYTDFNAKDIKDPILKEKSYKNCLVDFLSYVSTMNKKYFEENFGISISNEISKY